MQKERLNFSVNGRTLVYEGYPQNRPNDLMEALAKLEVNDDVVVPTFRENIADHESYQDEQILSMFSSARSLRQQRKARQQQQQQVSSADSPQAPPSTQEVPAPSPSSPALKSGFSQYADPAAPSAEANPPAEVKTRITLQFQGKAFSFNGYPSEKQNAVVHLLVKQRDGLTYESALETFRVNLPEHSNTPDNEIWTLISNAIQAKTGKPPTIAVPGEVPATSTPHADTVGHAENEDEELRNAINKYNAIPDGEKEEIRGFIRNLLQNQGDDVVPMASTTPRILGTQASGMDPGDSVGEASFSHQNPMSGLRTLGKIAIYCQEVGDKANTTRVIYCAPTVSFQELSSMVDKKFGDGMALSFEEDDDIVEIDDDDVLAMFFDTVRLNEKKVKLLCTKSSTRKAKLAAATAAANADILTSTETKEKQSVLEPFSNKELEVVMEKEFTGHSHAVYGCAFSLAGEQFVSCSKDRSVRIWSVLGKSDPLIMKGGHNSLVLACDFSPLGTRVVSCCAEDRAIKVWNSRTGSKASSLKGHTHKVYCVRYSPTGAYIASAACDTTVRVWSAETFSKEATLKGHTEAVFSCEFSNSDGGKYIVSGSDDRLVKIWDWNKGKEEKTLRGHTSTIWSVAFSRNDKYVVSASMGPELIVWSTETGSILRRLENDLSSPIHHAIFSPNDKYILCCSRDGSVRIWRAEDGELVERILAHSTIVYHMSINKEQLLTSSLDGTIKLWKVKNLLS